MSTARGYLGSYPTNIPKLTYGVVSKTSSDSASGLEKTTYRYITLFDSALGADRVFNRSLVLADSASCADIQSYLSRPLSDSALGADWISVITRITAGVPPLLFESLVTGAYPTASILLHPYIVKKTAYDSASSADVVLSRSFIEVDSASALDIVFSRTFSTSDLASAIDVILARGFVIFDSASALDTFKYIYLSAVDSSSALDRIPRRSFIEVDSSSAVDIGWLIVPARDLLYLTEISVLYLSSTDKMRTWDTRELLRYKIDTIWLSDIGRRAIIKAEHHDLRVDALLFICKLARKKLES
jgi:hypothetical protein